MRIFTLGTDDHSEALISKVISKYQIQVLADIRRSTAPKHEHHRRENIQRLCKENRAEYLYLGNELGSDREQGILSDLDPDLAARGIGILKTLARTRGLLILCTERTPERCNRRPIAAELAKEGAEVIHLLDVEGVWTPSMMRRQEGQARDNQDRFREGRDRRRSNDRGYSERRGSSGQRRDFGDKRSRDLRRNPNQAGGERREERGGQGGGGRGGRGGQEFRKSNPDSKTS